MRLQGKSLSLVFIALTLGSAACGSFKRNEDKELKRDNDRLQAEVAAAEQSRQAENASAIRARAESDAAVQKLRDDLAAAEAALSSRGTSPADAATIRTLTEDRDAKAAALAAATADNAAMKSAAAVAATSLTALEGQLKDATTRLTASDKVIADANVAIASALAVPTFDLRAANDATRLSAALRDTGASALRQRLSAALALNLDAAASTEDALTKAIERLRQTAAGNDELRRSIGTLQTDLATARGDVEKLTAKFNTVEEAVRGLLGAGFSLSAPNAADLLKAKLNELSVNPAGAPAAGVAVALGLAPDADNAAVLQAITALKAKEADLAAQLTALSAELATTQAALGNANAQLATVQADLARLQERMAAFVAGDALAPFAGIWLSEQAAVPGVPANCQLMVRVSAQPNKLDRVVICDDGNLELTTLTTNGLTTGLSPFPGAILLTTMTEAAGNSCGTNTSVVGAPSALSFDMRSTAGAEPAVLAYTTVGDAKLKLVSGSSNAELGRNNDCSAIVTRAGRAENADKKLLQTAAKACQLESQPQGCLTSGGFVPRS